MFTYIESCLIILLETLCCRVYYEAFGTKKKTINKGLDGVVLLLLTTEIFLSALVFKQNVILKASMVILGITIAMYIIFSISFIKSLILSFLFEGLMFVVDYLTLLFCIAVFQNVTNINDFYQVQGSLFVLLGKIILFFIVLLIWKTTRKYGNTHISDLDWIKFTFFPIYTICTIVGMIFVLDKPNSKNKDMIYFVIAFGLIGMNFIVFYLINDILKKETKIRKEQMLRIQMKNQTQMYYALSENYENQRKQTHEYKNQILCIESLLQRNKLHELAQYIKQIGSEIEAETDSISTNHVIADAILNTKYIEMLKKDIIFVFRINDLSKLSMEDKDIVIILSNLLNNAIEACEKCKNKKIVKLKFMLEDDTIIISTKNTYDGVLLMQENEYLTTKKDNNNHGIGIGNIISVIKRYHGDYVIKTDNNEFQFSIIIPNTTIEK